MDAAVALRHAPRRTVAISGRPRRCPPALRRARGPRPLAAGDAGVASKSEAYSEAMDVAMGHGLSYRHEGGMNWSACAMLPGVLVGSCLQVPADVARLAAAEGVGTILSLQQDCDWAYFGVDTPSIARAARKAGMRYLRVPVADFDALSLRTRLPAAAAVLEAELAAGRTVYVHCTAGMGRAPAVALAHAAWARGERLGEVAAALRAVRACNPRLGAIRGATADLLLGGGQTRVELVFAGLGAARRVQVAGLDVGWGAPADAVRAGPGTWTLACSLPPGRHAFKLILDGVWALAADHPSLDDGGHANNFVDVAPDDGADPARRLARWRLTQDEPLPHEQDQLLQALRGRAEGALAEAEAAGVATARAGGLRARVGRGLGRLLGRLKFW